MGQTYRRCPAREHQFGGYDMICGPDRSVDLHLKLLAEVAGDAIYDAACARTVAMRNREWIAVEKMK